MKDCNRANHGLPVYEKASDVRPIVSRQQNEMSIFLPSVSAMVRLFASLCFAITAFQAVADDDLFLDSYYYQFGQGLRLGDTGFVLGGYATASNENLRNGPSRTALDNVSLFIWWEGDGPWKFFSELDYENVLSSRVSNQEGENHYLALERLYFDYAFSNTTSIRAGKFLTPIGRWNLIHATPLVWTTSRPLITTRTFPTNATGLMVFGNLPEIANGVEYSLYGAAGSDIRPNPALDPFNQAIGSHLTLPFSTNGQIGFSVAAFEQEKTKGERKQLVGADFFWSNNRYEISAEGVYRASDNGSTWDEKGAFVQLVVPLSEKFYAVGRYEVFRQARETITTERWVTGLNYRFSPAIVLKTEWIGEKNNRIDAPEGLVSSVSILF